MQYKKADSRKPTRTSLPSQVVRQKSKSSHTTVASRRLKTRFAVAPKIAEWRERRKRTKKIAILVRPWSSERKCRSETPDLAPCQDTCDARCGPADMSSSGPPDKRLTVRPIGRFSCSANCDAPPHAVHCRVN